MASTEGIVKQRRALFSKNEPSPDLLLRNGEGADDFRTTPENSLLFRRHSDHKHALKCTGISCLMVKITYCPQVSSILCKQSTSDGQPAWFTDEDFSLVLNIIKQPVSYAVCLSAVKGENFCMYSNDPSKPNKPVVNVIVKGDGGDVKQPSQDYIDNLIKTLDEHWGSTCCCYIMEEETIRSVTDNVGIDETDSIGKGALCINITISSQVNSVLVQQQVSEATDGKSDEPLWFTEEDFDKILKKIKQNHPYEVCLKVTRTDGFYMSSSDHTKPSRPVVLVEVKGDSPDVTGIDKYVDNILSIIDDNWNGTCYVRKHEEI